MKRNFIKISMLAIAIILSAAFTMDAKGKTDAEKQKEKEIQAITDSINFTIAKAALENMDFAIIAEQLSFKNGGTVNATGNTNFISAHDGQAVVQLSSPGRGGLNGVGGVTVSGSITNFKTKTDKKGNFSIEYSVLGTAISARVFILIPNGSNRATATVYPNFNSDTLTVYGTVTPYESTSLFQGRSL